MTNSQNIYVLVHGAWHGAWAFDQTKTKIEESGAKVITLDLPGHGKDQTDITQVSFEAYVQKVKQELNKIEEKVILVGHSLAGFIVTKVVEEMPGKIEKLIFIAAMVPNNEKSVFEILKEDVESQLLSNLIYAEDQSWATVNEDTLKNVVYNGASDDQISKAAPNLVRQATQPFFVPVTTTEAFTQISKTYIKCTNDKIISSSAQQNLIEVCEIEKVIEIDTGHVPQIEKPIQLADAIINA